MQNLYKEANTITYTNSTGSTIESGDVIDFTSCIGVSYGDIDDGDNGAVSLAGQYILPKEAALAISQFAVVYWDSGNLCITTTAGANTFAGICTVAADAADSTVVVQINFGSS